MSVVNTSGSAAMLRLNDIRIPVRIAIACSVPMLAFIVFALKTIVEKHAIYSSADRIAAIAQTAPDISSLIHELQKERGATAGFVNSKGSLFADILTAQRPQTDKAVGDWRRRMSEIDGSASSAAFRGDMEQAQSMLGRLQSLRDGASRLDLTAQETSSYYTGTIARLVEMVDSIGAM